MTRIFISFCEIIRQGKDSGGEVVMDGPPAQGKAGNLQFPRPGRARFESLLSINSRAHDLIFLYFTTIFFFLPEERRKSLNILGEIYQFLTETSYVVSR